MKQQLYDYKKNGAFLFWNALSKIMTVKNDSFYDSKELLILWQYADT